MKWKSLGHVRLLWPHELYSSWNSPGQNTGVSSLSFLQRIFPTQGSKLGLLHCRWILYQLSHKGSPRILEWVAYLFSSISSQPTNQTGVSCIAGGFFTNWAVREAHIGPLLVLTWGFPGGSEVKNLPAVQELQETQEDLPVSGRSPGEGHGNALQYSCLENPMDREACWDTVHVVSELDMTEAT